MHCIIVERSRRARKKLPHFGKTHHFFGVVDAMTRTGPKNETTRLAFPAKNLAFAPSFCYSREVNSGMLQRVALGLSFFLTLTTGCGGSSTAHRYVPPKLPPMDRDGPVQSAAVSRPSIEATPKDENHLTPKSANASSIEKETGKSGGPCPPPSDVIRRMLANAMEMEKKTTDPEPHRAITEAVRMRLDEIYQHGCFRHIDDEHLLEAIAEIADEPKAFTELLQVKRYGDLGIWSYYGTYAAGAVAHYRWQGGMIRTSILVTGERGDMDKQLLVLSGKIAKLPSYPDPVLVIANTHPWMASCWRAMRIRVLAPSGDPIHPKVLLDKPLSGRWCEGMTTKVVGDTITFGYDGWGGPWSLAGVARSYTLSYQYSDGALVEHFGFPPRFQELPEDWIMRDWKFSQEATLESVRERLQPVHERLNKVVKDYEKAHSQDSNAEYSQEVFPVSDTERRIVLYCAFRDTSKPCTHWPKPVDFFIERRGEFWYVKDILARK
jgi:hypothetical protein